MAQASRPEGLGAIVQMSGQSNHDPWTVSRPVRRGLPCLPFRVLLLFLIAVGGCATSGSAGSPSSSTTAPGPSIPDATFAAPSAPTSPAPGPSTSEVTSPSPSAPTGPVIAWKRLALSREFSPQKPGGSARVTLVVPVVGGLVAFGGVTELYPGTPSVAVWTSRDSVAWRRAPTNPSFENAVALAATATGDGIVMVGTRDRNRAWVCHSTDGTTWKSVDQESFRDGVMRAVTEWGVWAPLVAVGMIVPPGGTAKHAAVWLSDAKGNWRLAKSPPAESELDIVVATQHGLLTFSSGPNSKLEASAVWTSADGDQWSKVGEVPGRVYAVVRTPTTIVAAGRANGAAAVWVSSDDGYSWTPSVVGQSQDGVIDAHWVSWRLE